MVDIINGEENDLAAGQSDENVAPPPHGDVTQPAAQKLTTAVTELGGVKINLGGVDDKQGGVILSLKPMMVQHQIIRTRKHAGILLRVC